MNLYNRYLMRPSGERKHQAKDSSERITSAVTDFLQSKKCLVHLFHGLDEEEINKTMEEMRSVIDNALEN